MLKLPHNSLVLELKKTNYNKNEKRWTNPPLFINKQNNSIKIKLNHSFMLNKFYLNLNKNYLFKNFLQSTFLN